MASYSISCYQVDPDPEQRTKEKVLKNCTIEVTNSPPPGLLMRLWNSRVVFDFLLKIWRKAKKQFLEVHHGCFLGFRWDAVLSRDVT